MPFALTFTSYSCHYDDYPILTAPSDVHRHNVHKSFTVFFYTLKMPLRKRKIFTVPYHKIQTYNLPTTIPKPYAEKQTA